MTGMIERPGEEEAKLKALLLGEEITKLNELEKRLADPDAVADTVAPALISALQSAGAAQPRKLADAVSPYMVQAMRREIRNSRDMMVEALYPITGQLVATAVRQSFKELLENIDSKLDRSFSFDRWRARVEAQLTGRSEAEIQLARLGAFSIEAAIVLERDTGRVLASVGGRGTEADDPQLVGGMIAAVMAFTREAISKGGETHELSTLEAGDYELKLFASPASVLAIRSRGAAPPGFERAVNELFWDFLDEWSSELAEASATGAPAGRDVIDDLRRRFDALLDPTKLRMARRSRKLLWAAAAAAIAALGWFAWQEVQARRAADIETRAWNVMREADLLTGFPIEPRWSASADRLEVIGFAPDAARRAELVEALRAELPDVDIALSVAALDGLDGSGGEALRRAERERSALEARIAELEAELGARIEAAAAASPFEALLRAIARDVRFHDEIQPVDPIRAQSKVGDVARAYLGVEDPPLLVVVGHGDEIGTREATLRASAARAELVRGWLIDQGVPESSVVAVGRGREGEIHSGEPLRNRRVSFELAGRP